MISHASLNIDALRRYDEVQAAFLNPRTGSTLEARDAVPKDGDPREAWETLAARGLIPADWIDHPRRAFAVDARRAVAAGLATDVTPTVRIHGQGPAVLLASPPDPLVTFVLGRDAVGVATAEDLARELVARLAPFASAGTPQPDRVAWSIVMSTPSSLPLTDRTGLGRLPVASALVSDATRASRFDLGRYKNLVRRGDLNRIHDIIARPVIDDIRWRAAVAEGLAFGTHGAVPKSVAGRSFRDVASPFDALIELWRTGYAVQRVTAEAIFLIARYPSWDG